MQNNNTFSSQSTKSKNKSKHGNNIRHAPYFVPKINSGFIAVAESHTE